MHTLHLGEIRPGGEGVGVGGSRDLLDGGEQCRVLVAGRGRVTRHTGEVGEIRPGGEGVGVRGSEDLLEVGSSAVYWSRAAAGSPASPVKRARFAFASSEHVRKRRAEAAQRRERPLALVDRAARQATIANARFPSGAVVSSPTVLTSSGQLLENSSKTAGRPALARTAPRRQALCRLGEAGTRRM